jgi:hypothetical protein
MREGDCAIVTLIDKELGAVFSSSPLVERSYGLAHAAAAAREETGEGVETLGDGAWRMPPGRRPDAGGRGGAGGGHEAKRGRERGCARYVHLYIESCRVCRLLRTGECGPGCPVVSCDGPHVRSGPTERERARATNGLKRREMCVTVLILGLF